MLFSNQYILKRNVYFLEKKNNKHNQFWIIFL